MKHGINYTHDRQVTEWHEGAGEFQRKRREAQNIKTKQNKPILKLWAVQGVVGKRKAIPL